MCVFMCLYMSVCVCVSECVCVCIYSPQDFISPVSFWNKPTWIQKLVFCHLKKKKNLSRTLALASRRIRLALFRFLLANCISNSHLLFEQKQTSFLMLKPLNSPQLNQPHTKWLGIFKPPSLSTAPTVFICKHFQGLLPSSLSFSIFIFPNSSSFCQFISLLRTTQQHPLTSSSINRDTRCFCQDPPAILRSYSENCSLVNLVHWVILYRTPLEIALWWLALSVWLAYTAAV